MTKPPKPPAEPDKSDPGVPPGMAEEKPGGTPNTERFESEVAPFKKDRA